MNQAQFGSRMGSGPKNLTKYDMESQKIAKKQLWLSYGPDIFQSGLSLDGMQNITSDREEL